MEVKTKKSENLMHMACVSLCKKVQISGLADFEFWHIPNGGMRSKSEAGRFKALGVLAGVPDLQFISRGKTFFVELKAAAGVASKSQVEFQRKVSSYGHRYYLIKATDCREAIEKMASILCREFEIDQNSISSISSKVLSNPIFCGSSQ